MTSGRPRPKRIALIAGESSGDVLGASLIEHLKDIYPDALFAGIGGPLMAQQGMDCWAQAEELAVMGIGEVVAHLPRLLALRSKIRKRMLEWQPDVMIGVDAPDFNLSVEQWLKERGVKTVHYVSPSVWAWRENRAAKIGKSADLVLCLFPMEPEIYAKHDVAATFVGHPLADEMPMAPDVQAARNQLDLANGVPVLAMLPGSRRSEVERLAPVFLDASVEILRAQPRTRIVVPLATPSVGDQFKALLDAHAESGLLKPAFHLVDRQAQAVMTAADVILLASGTAALEAMMAKHPMVVAHKIAPSTYSIVKTFGMLKTDVYSLPNILAGSPLVPELMQDNCTPEQVATHVMDAFEHTARFQSDVLPRFQEIHANLRRNAAHSAAKAVQELMENGAR